MIKIAIIGAGLSGLSVAHLLKKHSKIILFEKARGVSGRMSTREAQPYSFDHGAQYFTARLEPFQKFIQPLLAEGVIKRWNARYVKFDASQIVERKKWSEEEPRYVGVPGMNKVAKHLAKGLDIHINTKIESLKRKKKWELMDEKGKTYREFDWVISTVPSPQVKELFPQNFKYFKDIEAIEMLASFSLMLGFDKYIPLDFEAAHVRNADLSWIAVNSHKPGRKNFFTLMIHSSSAFANAHIDDDREEIMQHLLKETSRIIGHDVSIADHKAIHGWRYANTTKKNNVSIFLDHNQKLAACGDWCAGGRVEASFISAYGLSNAIKQTIL